MAYATEIIIDFLKYLHERTPPNLRTYADLAEYYWVNVIEKIRVKRNASITTVVIDKERFLLQSVK